MQIACAVAACRESFVRLGRSQERRFANGAMTKPASKHTSPEPGIAGWFRRLFFSGANSASAATPANDRATKIASSPRLKAAPAVPAQPTEPSADADPAWTEHYPAFAVYAHALSLPYAAPVPLTRTQAALVEQLASLVRAESAISDNDPAVLQTASLRVLQLVARSDLDFADLVAAVQQDPALAAAVLRVANSAALGAQVGSIQTVRDAVTRMGVADSARVVGVVATQALFNPQSKVAQRMFGPLLSELHVAASATASGAAQLSMDRGLGRSDLAFLGGMLHDVGKSLAIGALVRLIQAGDAPNEIEPVVVEAMLEAVNVDLGSMAHARWALPQYLVDLCAQQHVASCPLTKDTCELHLVRVAGGLTALRMRPAPRDRIAELMDSLGALEITPARARALDSGLRSRTLQVRQVITAS